jgi:D123
LHHGHHGTQWSKNLALLWPTVFVVAAAQVLLLLQSSDRIAHDICHAFDGCSNLSATPPAVTASADLHAATAQQSPADAAAQLQGRQQDMAVADDRDATATANATLPQAGVMTEEHRSGQNGAAAPVTRPQHVLVLRAWRDLRPGREFRCFVRGREIVGGSSSFMCSCCLQALACMHLV